MKRIAKHQKDHQQFRGICPGSMEFEDWFASMRPDWGFLGVVQRCAAAGLILVAWCSPTLGQERPAHPEEEPSETDRSISYGAQIAFGSGHADRGFVINDRPVVQPVVWVSGSVAEFSLWGSFPLAQTTDGSRPRIMELEVTGGHQWGNLWMAPAVRMFFYHDPLSSYSTRSWEAWLHLSYDVGPFSLFTNQSVDVLTYRGAYYGEAGIESEWHFSPTVEVGSSFGAGWASSKFNDLFVDINRSAFNRISAESWLTVYLESHRYISAHAEFSTIVDPRVRAEATRPSFIFVSLSIGFELGGNSR